MTEQNTFRDYIPPSESYRKVGNFEENQSDELKYLEEDWDDGYQREVKMKMILINYALLGNSRSLNRRWGELEVINIFWMILQCVFLDNNVGNN